MIREGQEFECAVCHEVFVSTWSDEEATAELSATWNDTEVLAVACDDCYPAMLAQARQEAPEMLRSPPAWTYCTDHQWHPWGAFQICGICSQVELAATPAP